MNCLILCLIVNEIIILFVIVLIKLLTIINIQWLILQGFDTSVEDIVYKKLVVAHIDA